MTLNWTWIGIGVAAFFIGYLVGLYEGRWKHRGTLKKLSDERDAARREKQKIQAALAEMREAYEALKSQPAPALSLEEKQGQVVLHLNGVAIAPKAITDSQHKRLLSLLSGLTPYIKRGKVAAKPQPSRRPPSAPQKRKSPASPPPAIAGLEPATPGTPASQARSIVEQIDDILQTMLEGTPLASRGIRLQEGPDGGVIVWVGISRYNGVDAIPDPEIKQVIQAAI
ncbi:MAG: hypothetical protein Q9M29_03765, partial [Mariprofundaceae bacterium]|nr:hypothetical protein [Mariprofundaceae bacterium]